ncbi:hypothetical protein FHJ30_04310 [Arthrobacter sp. BB-1]|uniref:hypothetical protein n=1 Tax=unclassified Arthrobacter TaxID=235627 RepID=UPI0011127E14|nr:MULTISPECIES: hypothetical protein [unclassified Arthrobacter]TNB75228.1 hypothetical protein FHJ30_04310 [Arthrobacter sp. BB-1]
MVDSTGFLGRAFHRNTTAAPPLADLLPAPGRELRTRFEPRFAELVGAVVATLRVAGKTPVPVSDPHGRQWAPAYILGRLEHEQDLTDAASSLAVAEVVVDGSGRMVRNHPVQVIRGAHKLLPVSCPSLADRYEQFILAVRMGEEPRGDAMVLTRHGDLMITGPGLAPIAVADYLNGLCRSAVGRAVAF